ncbi:hypothetical protein KH5_08340 [Urechidicola sp. KH5]
MLTFGVLFFAIGFVLVVFNTIDFKFVRDQEKSKGQAIAGFIIGLIGLFLGIWAVIRMMSDDI